MATDTLVFRDDGRKSYTENPKIYGIKYCKHCRCWHEKLQLETGTKFCAFCYTTHHSKACQAGFGQKCRDPKADPIHEFLGEECSKNQKFDLSFCKPCNCFHSKEAWQLCLENNPPKPQWDSKRKMIWKLRWDVCNQFSVTDSSLRKERSLFNLDELQRITPHEYPYTNGKFVHHCNVS